LTNLKNQDHIIWLAVEFSHST